MVFDDCRTFTHWKWCQCCWTDSGEIQSKCGQICFTKSDHFCFVYLLGLFNYRGIIFSVQQLSKHQMLLKFKSPPIPSRWCQSKPKKVISYRTSENWFPFQIYLVNVPLNVNIVKQDLLQFLKILWNEVWKGGFQLMQILGLLGMYFDAVVVEAEKYLLLFTRTHLTFLSLQPWLESTSCFQKW